MDFFEDSKENIWIGGMCGGFDMYQRSSGKYYSFDLPAPYQERRLEFFVEREGEVWVTTEDGVVLKVDREHPEKGIKSIVDIPALLASKTIQLKNSDVYDPGACETGAIDRLGRFWIVTQQGIYRFDDRSNELELFTKNVGVLVDDPDMNVYCAAFLSLLPDGKMLFTTRKGLCIFDPEKITNKEELPKAYISSISVNNQEIEKDSSSFFKVTYELGARENFVGFDFSALAFSNPFNIKFQYKLEGVDEEWKDPGEKRYVSYSQLKGGNYTFLLKAASASGTWQEEPVKVMLQIAKLWYQTAWARGLFLAAVIFSILFTYFSRLNRAIEKEHLKAAYERDLAELKMQALTAQMNPHFIFNSLNSIDFYIIKNDTRKASQYLNRFSRLMRLILKNSRSNYVSLQDDLEALQLYLEIEALRFDHGFEYEIIVDEQLDPDYVKIPPMLIQPYVENAIWHGLLHKKQNGKITINFDFNPEQEVIHCTVVDNGIGRKKSMEAKAKEISKSKRKSFGMNITKDKIEALNFLHDINATVNIIDLYDHENQGAGTKVELNIPV